MKIKLNNLDEEILNVILKIGRQADHKKISAYIVGGFVRDFLLKRENYDIDIVLEADAICFAKNYARGKKVSLITYKDFGTATIGFSSTLDVDLSTARKEQYVCPGALPRVEEGSLADDLERRDFSINALAVSINEESFGVLLDVCDGLADLKKGKIRALHANSFKDDPTRILRAVQYEQRLGFSMDRLTLKWLKNACAQKEYQAVKPARYFESFRKLLIEPSPYKCMKRLNQLGALSFFGKTYVLNLFLFSLVERNILVLKKCSFYRGKSWFLVYLLCLFDGVERSLISGMGKKLSLSREEKKIIEGKENVSSIILQLKKKQLSSREVYQILSEVSVEIIYFIRVRTSVNIVVQYIDDFLKNTRNVSLKMTGEDVKAMGVAEGKLIGRILREVLLKKINGNILTYQQEKEYAQELIKLLQNERNVKI